MRAAIATGSLVLAPAAAGSTFAPSAGCGSGPSRGPDGLERQGMSAPADGAGQDSNILGCSASGQGAGVPALGAQVFGSFAVANGDGASVLGYGASADRRGSAFGMQAAASGITATALGQWTRATGVGSVAIGGDDSSNDAASGAQASGDRSVAIAGRSRAQGPESIAVGSRANAGGHRDIAIGADALASAGTAVSGSAVAVGYSAQATGVGASAFGASATASGPHAVALGAASEGRGGARALGAGAVAIGGNFSAGAVAVATDAIAIGGQAGVDVGAASGIAIGRGAQVFSGATVGIAHGDGALVFGAGDIAIGMNARTSGGSEGDNIVIGRDLQTGEIGHNVAIGSATTAAVAANTGSGAVAVGRDATANGDGAVALGADSEAGSPPSFFTPIPRAAEDDWLPDDGAVAIGKGNRADGRGAVAIGYESRARHSGSIALGQNAEARIEESIALGTRAMATESGNIAIGYNATAGDPESDSALNDLVVRADSVALGANATAVHANAVALGAHSVTEAAVGTAGAVIGGVRHDFAGSTPTSTVSVGSAGAERTVTNVAAGRLSANSTDAVNGSQLHAANEEITAVDARADTLGAGLAGQLGGGAAYDAATGQLTGPTYTVNGTRYGTVQSAVEAAGAGWRLSADGGATSNNIGPGDTVTFAASGNATVSRSGDTITYGMVDNPNFAGNLAADRLSAGDTAIDTRGLTTGGGSGPSITVGGVDAAGTKVSNVANGTVSRTSTDAVNGAQLFATHQSIENLNNAVDAGRVRYVSVNSRGGGNEDNRAATGADAVALGKDASATIDGAVAVGAGAVADRPVAPTAGRLPAGGGGAIPYDTTDRRLMGSLSVGSAGSYRQITNVADGTQSQDAVTVRQLAGALSSIQSKPTRYFQSNSTQADALAVGSESVAMGPQAVVNGDNGVGIGNAAIVQQDAPDGVAIGAGATAKQAGGVALGAGSVASTPAGAAGYEPPTATASQRQAIRATRSTKAAVSVGNAAAGQYRQVNGVAAGTADSDAVNVAQMRGVQGTVAAVDQSSVKYDKLADGTVDHGNMTLGGSGAGGPVSVHNVAPGVAGTDAVNVHQLSAQGHRFNQQLDAVNTRIDGVEKNAYAGVAAAMAMEMPASYIPGKTAMRIGVGTFKGEHAVGLSFRRTSKNGEWSVSGGVSTSRAGVGAAAGVEWVF